MAKVNAVKLANTLINSQFNLEVINSNANLDDYSQEDIMKLLLNRISQCSHKSDCLVSKANTIVNSKIETKK